VGYVGCGGGIGWCLTPLRGQLGIDVTWAGRGNLFRDSALRASDMMGDISIGLFGWFFKG
jgi:hypothetical protein